LKLQTLRFGEIDINEEGIVSFPTGLPGFEDLEEFVFIQDNPELPFAYMQSTQDGDVSFIIANPFVFFPDYEFELSDATQVELEIKTEEDVRIYVILNAAETMEHSTINLLAPLVINFGARLGAQIILHNTSYLTKHPLSSIGG
jgi:flagellar assembly factor FliW